LQRVGRAILGKLFICSLLGSSNVQQIEMFMSVVLRLLIVFKGGVSNVLGVLFLLDDHHRFMLSFAIDNTNRSHTENDQ